MNETIPLSDGRNLGYAEFGSPAGKPIIYCHGSQSSRLEMHYDITFAISKNLRIITVDRPGHGLSDFNPNGTILSFAQDVIELTRLLKIDRFAVVGMSAGSPFALGLAYSFPNSISNVAIISGFAPFTSESKLHLSKQVKSMLSLAKSMPFLLRLMLKLQIKQLEKNPTKALNGFLSIMSPPDQAVLKNDSVMEVIEIMFKEAFRNGSRGVAHEISNILVHNWQFNLSDITVPVKFWQGDQDNNVPAAWAELMKNSIPKADLKLLLNEGHLIIFKHAEAIFTEVSEGLK